jgi:hypothetical protein
MEEVWIRFENRLKSRDQNPVRSGWRADRNTLLNGIAVPILIAPKKNPRAPCMFTHVQVIKDESHGFHAFI